MRALIESVCSPSRRRAGRSSSAAKFSAPVERWNGTFIVISDSPMVNGERFH